MSEVREDLRITYLALWDRLRPNEYTFVQLLEDDDPGAMYSLAKIACYGLKLYVRCSAYDLTSRIMFRNECA